MVFHIKAGSQRINGGLFHIRKSIMENIRQFCEKSGFTLTYETEEAKGEGVKRISPFDL